MSASVRFSRTLRWENELLGIGRTLSLRCGLFARGGFPFRILTNHADALDMTKNTPSRQSGSGFRSVSPERRPVVRISENPHYAFPLTV